MHQIIQINTSFFHTSLVFSQESIHKYNHICNKTRFKISEERNHLEDNKPTEIRPIEMTKRGSHETFYRG